MGNSPELALPAEPPYHSARGLLSLALYISHLVHKHKPLGKTKHVELGILYPLVPRGLNSQGPGLVPAPVKNIPSNMSTSSSINLQTQFTAVNKGPTNNTQAQFAATDTRPARSFRTLQACLSCHKGKVKCNSNAPSPCNRCIKLDKSCIYGPIEQPSDGKRKEAYSGALHIQALVSKSVFYLDVSTDLFLVRYL